VSKTPDGQFSIMHPIILVVSGIGPTLWLVMVSDLRCISDINLLFKYGEDTNLLVPENTDADLAVEFGNIQRWADSNGMVINLHKTKKIVLHRPHPRRWSLHYILIYNAPYMSIRKRIWSAAMAPER